MSRRAVLALGLALAVGLKAHYRTAEPEALAWVLGPTAALTGLLTGSAFDRGASGWINGQLGVVLAPECAGVNFLVVALLSATVGLLPLLGEDASEVGFLAATLAVSYGATVVVNTVRVLIAIELAALESPPLGLTAAELHRAEGVLVYLSALCALFLGARAFLVRRYHVTPVA